MLTQQCGKCLRRCCPECYAPWHALACGACRAEARGASAEPSGPEAALRRVQALVEPPAVKAPPEPPGEPRCRSGSRARSRSGARPRSHRDRADVRTLADRVADLERRLSELRPGP